MIDSGMDNARLLHALHEIYGIPVDVLRLVKKLAANASLINASGTLLVLKIHSNAVNSRLEFLEGVYKAANRSGVMPKVLASQHGALLNFVGERVVSLQNYHPGGTAKPDPYELGRRLACLHDAFSATTLPDLGNHLTAAVPDVAVAARKHGLESLVSRLQRVQEIIGQGPRQIVHGDLHSGNILTQEDGRPLFLDPDSARTCLAFSDLAFVCFRVHGTVDMNAPDVAATVDAYVRARPETPVWPERLKDFALYLLARRVLFIRVMAAGGDESYTYDLPKLLKLLEPLR